MTLHLLPPDFELPAGLKYRQIADRPDLFDGCRVIQVEEAVEGLEKVSPEQWEYLGFTIQDDIDAYKTVDADGNETWMEVSDTDKDAEFSAQQVALIDQIYGPESQRAVEMKTAILSAVSQILQPSPVKRMGG